MERKLRFLRSELEKNKIQPLHSEAVTAPDPQSEENVISLVTTHQSCSENLVLIFLLILVCLVMGEFFRAIRYGHLM